MPCSFSLVLPRSPNRYGRVQKSSAVPYGTGAAFVEKSAAYTPPQNSDEKAIPTPHTPAVFINLRNIYSSSRRLRLCLFRLTSLPKALEPGTHSLPSGRRPGSLVSTGAWIRHARSPVLAGNASAARVDAPWTCSANVDLGAARATPASAC